MIRADSGALIPISTARYTSNGLCVNQNTGVISSGYPAGYSVEEEKLAATPPDMIRAEIRYADSSGVDSGTTCARLSQARSPAWTSHPATSSRPPRQPPAGGSTP